MDFNSALIKNVERSVLDKLEIIASNMVTLITKGHGSLNFLLVAGKSANNAREDTNLMLNLNVCKLVWVAHLLTNCVFHGHKMEHAAIALTGQ